MANEDVAKAVSELCATLVEFRDAKVILVSNEVGLGIVPDNALARRFADYLGVVNQRVAAAVERVVLVTAGIPLVLKSEQPNTEVVI